MEDVQAIRRAPPSLLLRGVVLNLDHASATQKANVLSSLTMGVLELLVGREVLRCSHDQVRAVAVAMILKYDVVRV